VWHKTITVASRTGRIFFFLKPYAKDAVPAVKKIPPPERMAPVFIFSFFSYRFFLAKFNNKLENLVEFTHLKKKNFQCIFSHFPHIEIFGEILTTN
jgi:hypothetical protein